jgi:hypothetical protein
LPISGGGGGGFQRSTNTNSMATTSVDAPAAIGSVRPDDARRALRVSNVNVSPSRSRSRSSARTAAVAYRALGFFSRHFRQIASNVGEMCRTNRRGGTGGSCITRRIVSWKLDPWNGATRKWRAPCRYSQTMWFRRFFIDRSLSMSPKKMSFEPPNSTTSESLRGRLPRR